MLFLAGGGDASDSVLIDRRFAQEVSGKRLLYLPIAMDAAPSRYAECDHWIRQVFAPLGVVDIVMWDVVTSARADEMRTFDAIYLGGGNTYKLLSDMKGAGFDDAIGRFHQNGGHVYGGSAGAIVLGADISTCSITDANYLGLTETNGLGLVGKYSIWCHYLDTHYPSVCGCDHPVLAIPERSGIVVDGSTLSVIGPEHVLVFDQQSRRTMLPGQTLQV